MSDKPELNSPTGVLRAGINLSNSCGHRPQ